MSKRGLKLNNALVKQLRKQGLNQELLAQIKPAGSKMRNRHTVVDNITFDSRLEAARYQDLKVLQQAGRISELKYHVVFHLVVNGIQIGNYEADFTYREAGGLVIEDCKGQRTPLYVIKKNLMKALYGIEIVEIVASRWRRNR
ncbi:MAG: DUF1064 domain-containing protein [Acidobacteria bacterium]|nr:DUF1064 domain-containing protein [Acidobacteriota bacterium]